ncbi:hypothetical protein ES703_101477 [subsurface metagenome]
MCCIVNLCNLAIIETTLTALLKELYQPGEKRGRPGGIGIGAYLGIDVGNVYLDAGDVEYSIYSPSLYLGAEAGSLEGNRPGPIVK